MPGSKKKIAGIVLAAGTGSRMGRTKQLLPFGGSTLLEKVVATARASDLDDVIVVLGHDAKKILTKTDLPGTRIVINRRFAMGQATSLQAGLGSISSDASGAMFLLADQPLIDKQIINALIDAWQTSNKPMLVPYCKGVRGNPVIVGASLFSALSGITGDRGARALFKEFPDKIKKINIDNPAILTDVDTKEEYDRLSVT